MESIISALIAGGLALIGVIITNISNSRSIENKLAMSQAVTETKLDALTEEVRRHNSFAERIPALEAKVPVLEAEVKQIKDTLKGGKSA